MRTAPSPSRVDPRAVDLSAPGPAAPVSFAGLVLSGLQQHSAGPVQVRR